MTDSTSTSEEFPPLHELLKAHLETCSRCQSGLTTKPHGMGQVSNLCFEYQDIIARWADREGKVNNIVDYDEYGNPGTESYWQEIPRP